MARGWEKEDVAEKESSSVTPALQKKAEASAEREKKLRVQTLTMQRERILNERTASPHRRTALEAALLEIERELADLGWTIHI